MWCDLAGSFGALLLPGRCGGCGVEADGPLCDGCLGRCEAPLGPCCPRCGADWRPACRRCERFGRPFAFESAAAIWRYRGPVRRLVHAFKYGGRRDLLAALGRRLAQAPRAAGAWGGAPRPLVVPVPARPRSRRRRGYDQAEDLARAFAASLGLDFDARALRRRRDDGPQAGRSRRQRRLQAAAAMSASSLRIDGRRVLLVDDVLSTGATADAGARALLRAGARSVRVLALAS